MCGTLMWCPASAPPVQWCGWIRTIRCSCSTPRALLGSLRALSTQQVSNVVSHREKLTCAQPPCGIQELHPSVACKRTDMVSVLQQWHCLLQIFRDLLHACRACKQHPVQAACRC